MKNARGFAGIAFVVVVVAVVGGAGWWYLNQSNVSRESPVPILVDEGVRSVEVPSANQSDRLTITWKTGDFMDYPSDVTVIPTIQGASRTGPTFIFPKSYFTGSAISDARVTSYASCGSGGEEPASGIVTIEGAKFYRTPDGLSYTYLSACNERIQLLIETNQSTDVSSAAYQNLRSIFDIMVASYAKKVSR